MIWFTGWLAWVKKKVLACVPLVVGVFCILWFFLFYFSNIFFFILTRLPALVSLEMIRPTLGLSLSIGACLAQGVANIDLQGANSHITLDAGETAPLEVTSAFLRGLESKITALEAANTALAAKNSQLTTDLATLASFQTFMKQQGGFTQAACETFTNTNAAEIIANDAGTLKLNSLNSGPAGVFSASDEGVVVAKTGSVIYMSSQSFRTPQSTSYVYMRLDKNGAATYATNSVAGLSLCIF